MSGQMSIEDIKSVVDASVNPIKTDLADIKACIVEARRNIGDSIVKYAVIENELNNHKKQQDVELSQIRGDLNEVGKKTRVNTKFTWAFGGGMSVAIVAMGVILRFVK